MKSGSEFFYLSSSPGMITRQLSGEEFDSTASLNLAQNVSTDAIFPTRGATANFNSLGLYALSNFEPIKEGDLNSVRPKVLVVGNGFGTGSSREHAPIALKQAGIRKILCIGGRVERIFLENCLMSGIEVYEYPRTIDLAQGIEEAFENDRFEQTFQDRLRPDIARVGGISAYNRMRLEGKVEPMLIRHNEVGENHPMTAAEKILAANMVNVAGNEYDEKVVRPGDTGFVHLDYRMSYELHSPITATVLENELGDFEVRQPSTVHLFQDHSALFAIVDPRFTKLIKLQKQIADKYGLRVYSPDFSDELTEGICHTLSIEKSLIGPGEVGIGTDSHMCSLGVLNALSWGIGATHFANTLVTNEALVEVPQSVKITLNGNLHEGTTPKDLMLYILSQEFVKDGSSTNTVFEYDGEGLDTMTLGEQMVLTNMSVEGRAMTGIVTRLTSALKEHLKLTRETSDQEIEESFVTSDEGAQYYKTLQVNLSDIEPMVALPGDPRNGIPLSQLQPQPVANVYIGSCTGGNLEDLEAVARVL